MQRRRLLALGASAVGFSGCLGLAQRYTRPTRTEPTPTESTTTSAGGPSRTTTATEPTPQPDVTPSVGGSLHGRPWRLADDLRLLERSGTNWLHAFLDVRKKFDSDVPPREDPDVVALRRASREMGVNLFVSLQWNFVGIFGEQGWIELPEAGSGEEAALIQYAGDLLEAIGEPVSILGLGNEPVWETMDVDFMGRDSALIAFTRRLKEYLVDRAPAGDPRLVVGAFNRLYSEAVRERFSHFYRQLYEMARDDDDVDGIDLHCHYRAFEQAEAMLAEAREHIPDGLITVTEFSPIWRYEENLDERITTFEGGERFTQRYGVDRDTTVAEYFEAAKDDRLSREEMGEFMEAMPWYNVEFVQDFHDLMGRYDVEVGTFGFLVEDDVKQLDWTDDWAPFPINCLFQPAIIDTEDGAHPHYLEDFRELARGSEAGPRSGSAP